MQPSPGADPLLGSVLLGTYRVERLLGRGGMGSVYEATHVHLQTPCALKVLLREFNAEGEPLKRFQREAQITSQLGHPNIVRVTDFNFTPDGAPFMVMELLLGETLLRRLRDRGQLTLPEVVRLFGPLCDALGLAHDKGVVHRDLKPENIFLPQDLGLDGAKILDFGISKIRDGNTRLTKADMTMGTQSYMAPELVMGAAAEADIRSDVFSLGAILFEVLTAKLAYDGPNAMAVMYKLVYQDPPSVRAFDAAIPVEVEQVVLRALSRNPEQRIASAPALFQAFLDAALPYLPAAEDMEAQMSTPYRYTSGAMRAVRQTNSFAPVGGTGPNAIVSGPPTPEPKKRQTGPQAGPSTGPQFLLGAGQTGPQLTLGGPRLAMGAATRITPPGQRPAPFILAADDSLPDAHAEHAQQRRRKSGGLVMGIIVGLVALTCGGLFLIRQRLTAGSAAPAPAVQKAPAAAVAPPAAPPVAPAPMPAASPTPAVPPESVDAKDGKEKKKRRRSRHSDELPRVELPTADE